MDSAGVATETQEIHMESLEAKIEQFNASTQEMYYDFLDSDLAKGVVDFGTYSIQAIDGVIDKFGSLGTAIAGVATGSAFKGLMQIFRGGSGQAGGLSAGLNGVAKALQGFGSAFQESWLTEGNGFFTSLGKGLGGFWGGLGSVGKVLTVVGIGATAYNIGKDMAEQWRQGAEDAAVEWSESNTSLQDYRSQIEDLGASLESGTLSNEETYEVNAELLSIQEDLVESYGNQASSLDLVNGELKEQLALVDQISAENAREYTNDNKNNIQVATRQMEGFSHVIGAITQGEYDTFSQVIEGYEDYFTAVSDGVGSYTVQFAGNAEDAEYVLEDVKSNILDIREESNNDTFFNGLYNGANDAENAAADLVDKWGEVYDAYREAAILQDTGEYTYNGKTNSAVGWMKDYAEAVEDYNDALASGDSSKIKIAERNYKNVNDAMSYFESDEMSDYTYSIDQIGNSLDNAAVSAYEFEKSLRGEGENQDLADFANDVKDLSLSNTEFKNSVLSDRAAGEETIFTKYADEAEDAGYSLDDFGQLLVDIGVLSGIASKQIEDEGDTFEEVLTDETKDLSSKISDTRSTLDGLNDTLDEVRNNEEIDIADLINDYDVSGNLDTLEQELSDYGVQEVRDFVSDYNDAISNIKKPEELEKAQNTLDTVLSSVDFSYYTDAYYDAIDDYNKVVDEAESAGVDLSEALFGNLDTGNRQIRDANDNLEQTENEIKKIARENMLSNIPTDELTQANAESIVKQIATTVDTLFDEYSDDEYTLQAVLQLTADPSSLDWTIDEFGNNVEDRAIKIRITGDEKDIAGLEKDLTSLQNDASRIQNDITLAEALGNQATAKNYDDLIKNSRLQLQTYEDELELLQDERDAAIQYGLSYEDIDSDILSVESSMISAISSQREWNEELKTMRYEAGEALNAYNDATSTRNAGDNYADMKSALEAAEKLYEEGKTGVDEFQKAAEMISPNGMSGVLNWEENYGKVQRYFTDGTEGSVNLLNDLASKTNEAGEALASYDESAQRWSVNMKDLAASADAVGISEEAMLAILGNAADYELVGDNFFTSTEEGIAHIGELYNELAQEQAKLQELEASDNPTITKDVLQEARNDIARTTEDIAASYELVNQLSAKEAEDFNAEWKQHAEVLAAGLEQLDKVDKNAQNAYLSQWAEQAEEWGMPVSDLFYVDKDGMLELNQEALEEFEADNEVGGKYQIDLEYDESATVAAAKDVANKVTSTFDDVSEETGESLHDMFDQYVADIADEAGNIDLSGITWGNGALEAGFEDAERGIDNMLKELGLTQDSAEALGQIIVEYAQSGDIVEAANQMVELQRATEESSSAAVQLGQSLSETFADTVDESGQNAAESMMQSFIDEFGDQDLSGIIFGNNQYEEGFEGAEAALDSMITAFGLAQSDGEALLELINAFAETGSLELAIDYLINQRNAGEIETGILGPYAEEPIEVDSEVDVDPQQIEKDVEYAFESPIGLQFSTQTHDLNEEITSDLEERQREREEELDNTITTHLEIENKEEIDSLFNETKIIPITLQLTDDGLSKDDLEEMGILSGGNEKGGAENNNTRSNQLIIEGSEGAKEIRKSAEEAFSSPIGLTFEFNDKDVHEELETEFDGEGETGVAKRELAKLETSKVEAEEIEASEIETPEIEAFELETPEIETPEIEAPEIETPEVETPEIETPEIEAIETEEIEEVIDVDDSSLQEAESESESLDGKEINETVAVEDSSVEEAQTEIDSLDGETAEATIVGGTEGIDEANAELDEIDGKVLTYTIQEDSGDIISLQDLGGGEYAEYTNGELTATLNLEMINPGMSPEDYFEQFYNADPVTITVTYESEGENPLDETEDEEVTIVYHEEYQNAEPIESEMQVGTISMPEVDEEIPVTGEMNSVNVSADLPPIPVTGVMSNIETTENGTVNWETGSSPDQVSDASGIANYTVGDYPATVPDASGIANYSLGSYPTSVPPVTGTANYVLGSYPTSLPTITQTVVQNVVKQAATGTAITGIAHASGTANTSGYSMWVNYRHSMGAYANGSWKDWAIPHNEDAIVNEFGDSYPESIVIILRLYIVICIENLSNCWKTIKPIKLQHSNEISASANAAKAEKINWMMHGASLNIYIIGNQQRSPEKGNVQRSVSPLYLKA